MKKKKQNISIDEYRRIINVSGRKSSTVHQSDKAAAIEQEYDQAVQALRVFQGIMRSTVFGKNDVQVSVKIYGKSKGDGSNYLKGVEDALNSIAYDDDRQSKKGIYEFC